MKKKSFCMLLCVLAMLGLCACGDDAEPLTGEDAFIVELQVDCEDEIKLIHIEYYLDGQAVGGGLTGNANGSILARGDVLSKDFIPEDFPEAPDLSTFQLEIFVLDENEREYPCGDILSFSAAYGNSYRISITGSYREGFSAVLTGDTAEKAV